MRTAKLSIGHGIVCLSKLRHSRSQSVKLSLKPEFYGIMTIENLRDVVDDGLLLHRGPREGLLSQTESTAVLGVSNYP